MGEPWMRSDPMPDRCYGCTNESHDQHQEFFEAELAERDPATGTLHVTRYGPFSCDCPCTPENAQYLVSTFLEGLFDDPEKYQED